MREKVRGGTCHLGGKRVFHIDPFELIQFQLDRKAAVNFTKSMSYDIESFKPRLIAGEIVESDDDFKFVNSVQNIKLPKHALKPFRLMDGTLALSEILLKMYREEKALSFRQIFKLLQHLTENQLLAESDTLAELLKATRKSPPIQSDADFSGRVEVQGQSATIDLQSKFVHSALIDRLGKIPLFRQIEQSKLIQLMQKAKIRTFRKGLFVVTQGSDTNCVFILLSGKVSVFKKQDDGQSRFLANLHPTSVFGEYAAFLGIKRNADVVTQEDSEILVINVDHLREAKADPVPGLQSDTPLYEELRRNVVLSQTLGHSELFKNLPLDLIQLIISMGQTKSHSKSDIIIREGDIGKSFYLLLAGAVAVLQNEIAINHHSAGDFFGEISLIKRVPRTATVRCSTDVLLLKITRDEFYELLSKNLFLALFLEREAESRLGSNQN